MAAKIAVSHIDKELECSICLDIYTKPKLLKCMHTFCENCILQISIDNINNGTKTISCPNCRGETKMKINEVLPTNLIVANLISVLQNRSEQPKCHDCVGNEIATHHCNNCMLNLCADCERYHNKSLKYTGHQVVEIQQVAKAVSLNPTSRYCTVHKELLKYYCEDCSSMVCNDCMISSSHKSHNFCIVDEIKVRLRQEVDQLVNEGHTQCQVIDEELKKIEDFRKEIEENRRKSIAAIKNCFKEIHQELKKREDFLIQQVVADAKVSSESEGLASVETRSKNLKRLIDYVNQLSQENSGGNVVNVEVLCDLKKQLKESVEMIKIPQFHQTGYAHGQVPFFQHQRNVDPNENRYSRCLRASLYPQTINSDPNEERYFQSPRSQSAVFKKFARNFSKNVGNIKVDLKSSFVQIDEKNLKKYKAFIPNTFQC